VEGEDMTDANCPTCLALQAEVARLTQQLGDVQLTLSARSAAVLNTVKRQNELEWEVARLTQEQEKK
jgi:hypothetical protein